MKVLAFLALAAFASAETFKGVPTISAHGYIQKIGIPLAEKIRKAEEAAAADNSRIIGGSPSQLGQFPYQVGLLSSYAGISGTGICGGSIVTPNRVITAAHCWFDGVNQAVSTVVVAGSTYLFSGGTRITSTTVAVHPAWRPILVVNDVAVIYLPTSLSYSNVIGPIALPSGSEIEETFAGEVGVASGFGLTVAGGSIPSNQFLSHVELGIITNSVCRIAFPFNLRDSNICTSGVGGPGTCQGDSGGPLAVTRNGRPVLAGITSFGSGLGCDSFMPAVYARTTSFLDFFYQHL